MVTMARSAHPTILRVTQARGSKLTVTAVLAILVSGGTVTPMADTDSSDVSGRLRLVDSLLRATGDGLSSLQRLLTELCREIELARRDMDRASRSDELQTLRREVEQLRDGLASRAVIERSKGILMRAYSLTESQAFDLLSEMSQSRHRKLRDVAGDVATGTITLPASATARQPNVTAGTERPRLVNNGARTGQVDRPAPGP